MFVALVTMPFVLTACAKKPRVKVIDIKLTSEEYAIGVNLANTDLLAKVNDFLIEIKSNGTFNRIIAKYFGGGPPQGVKSAPENTENALVVVTSADFPPFEYKEGDTYYGVDIEIVAALAKKLGKRLVIKNVAFESVFYELQLGHADLAAAALSAVEIRKNIIAFSNSYYVAGQVIMVRADDTTFANCATAEDVVEILKGMDHSKRAGYQHGSSAYYYLFAKSHEFTSSYSVTGMGYDSISDAVAAMLNGEVDFVVLDSAAANALAKKYNGKKK